MSPVYALFIVLLDVHGPPIHSHSYFFCYWREVSSRCCLCVGDTFLPKKNRRRALATQTESNKYVFGSLFIDIRLIGKKFAKKINNFVFQGFYCV